jgi:hypothetical protein
VLVKLVLKILFKASLPLVAVAGVLSYGLYLKGGDPISMWSTIASRAVGSVRESSVRTADSVKALAPMSTGASNHAAVFSWVDQNGVKHYGSAPPAGVEAKPMSIRTSAGPSSSTAYRSTATSSNEPSSKRSNTAAASLQTVDGEPLPGMAGVKLPMNIKPEDLGLDREEILKLLNPN